MSADDLENDEAAHIVRFRPLLVYQFRPADYDIDSFDCSIHEADVVLAVEIKRYYSELAAWPDRALGTAWRRYSKEVGLVDEEYVCARLPNFLAYLFVKQEKWPVRDDEWSNALDVAIAILWPTSD